MSTYSAQEFLNAIAPGPVDADDRVMLRALGRGQNLTKDDDPWRFDAVPTVRGRESGLELTITVTIPVSDVAEAAARVRG